MNCLIVNPGSTSKKYALYASDEVNGDLKRISYIYLERLKEGFLATVEVNNQSEQIRISDIEFASPYRFVLGVLQHKKVLNGLAKIDCIAIRIVAPGVFFQEHKQIDEGYVDELVKVQEVAPLHITSVLEEIYFITKEFDTIPIYGISDSAFHSSLPDISKYYAIPKSIADEHGILRFGYHGISIESSISSIKRLFGQLPSRIIICHLGGGCSVTAVLDGKSIDTSMGFSPMEGLTMATRSGDIDAGATIMLAKKLNFSLDSLEHFLNTSSGLKGLSGTSSDIRKLLDLEAEGDARAKLALDHFVYKLQKYIGSYVASLNGVDLIVFSGTIGERSYIIRERVCKNLTYLGLTLNPNTNNGTFERNNFIHDKDSKVAVATIVTDEVGQMAKIVEML